MAKQFLRDRELAEELDISVSKVRAMRLRREGPAWLKVGGSIRYRREDVERYLAACKVETRPAA
ncbi:MAG: helix-turn-helix domain-containing protein [Bryobacteraceae bacterium]|nr:helix-turn-helix domain-containing protein [Bryobacteraceae bacterium]